MQKDIVLEVSTPINHTNLFFLNKALHHQIPTFEVQQFTSFKYGGNALAQVPFHMQVH